MCGAVSHRSPFGTSLSFQLHLFSGRACCSHLQVGELPFVGNGRVSKVRTAEISVHELEEQRDENNSSVLMRLREDARAAQLLQAMRCYVNPVGCAWDCFAVLGLS
jgi:hypothetical protein